MRSSRLGRMAGRIPISVFPSLTAIYQLSAISMHLITINNSVTSNEPLCFFRACRLVSNNCQMCNKVVVNYHTIGCFSRWELSTLKKNWKCREKFRTAGRRGTFEKGELSLQPGNDFILSQKLMGKKVYIKKKTSNFDLHLQSVSQAMVDLNKPDVGQRKIATPP